MSCPCAWLPADEAGWGAAAKLLMQLRTKRHPTWEQPLPPLLLGLTPYTLLQKLLLLLRREKRLGLAATGMLQVAGATQAFSCG